MAATTLWLNNDGCHVGSMPLDVAKKLTHQLMAGIRADPGRWQSILVANWREGKWYTLLSLDPASQTEPFDQTYPQGLPAPLDIVG
jgi:hypothetical protein